MGWIPGLSHVVSPALKSLVCLPKYNKAVTKEKRRNTDCYARCRAAKVTIRAHLLLSLIEIIIITEGAIRGQQ